MTAKTGTRTLLETSQRVAIRKVDEIYDFAGLDLRLCIPILNKVRNADQLRQIEENTPDLVGHTRDVWISIFKRDITNWNENEPKNPASWYKLYKKLISVQNQKESEDAMILKDAMNKIAAEKATRTIGTTNMLSKGSARHRPGPSQPTNQSSLRFNNGSRTKMVTGKDVIARARREAREKAQALNTKSVLARPTHTLNERATTVRNVPIGLVQQHQRAQQPATAQKPVLNEGLHPNPRNMFTVDREARLKAIKAQQKPATTTPSVRPPTRPVRTQLANLPDQATERKREVDDLDNLFGDSGSEPEAPPAKKQRVLPSTTSRPAPSREAKDVNINLYLRKPTRKAVR